MTDPNLLYYGDNLDVLRRHVATESVDLVYLDPPFNSNANYNVLFAEHGEKAAAQVRAFEDTWVWDTNARLAYEETVEQGGRVADALRAFRTMLGASDMLAYLAMMAPRLVELHRVLKPTGSLYLHCDPTASHYLKLLLDAAFGAKNFRNEIIWKRTGSHNSAKRFGPVHDVILYVARSPSAGFVAPTVAYTEKYLEHFNMRDDRGPFQAVALTGPGVRTGDSGQPWRNYNPTTVGRHWQPASYLYSKYIELTGDDLAQFPLIERLDKLEDVGLIYWGSGERTPRYRFYLSDAKGSPIQDIWDDIPPVNSQARERLGWDTQKPLALLARIISASSSPGDLVLDPFCGCGTAIDAAQDLGRRWIGIDVTHLAVGLIRSRLAGRYGPEIAKTYRVIGEPTTVDDAEQLAKDDPFQFQAWALGLVGARIATSDKKGGDKGIDGRLYFHDSVRGPTRQIVFSVKAGHLVPAYVDALWGVIEREQAEIGVLISFSEPTKGMRERAAEAGFYESYWGKHPKIQLRTVGELLSGKGIDYPHVTGSNVTVRRAARATAEQPEHLELFGPEDAA